MKTSVPLAAAAFLLLLLTTMEAEAIRLDAEIRAAVNQQQQVAYKPGENLAQKDAPVKSSVGESETKRSIAGQEQVRATAHKLPEFHEDYYGASVHEPRHH
ncbi:hypothetical protein GQ55_1G424600 [Panicum hallii var. hallii]|uniref:Uncharacterized protein n=2 Tax=Panicum hallii TaxID=206008 RepID=A0A2T7FDD7_9POAL|nr:uncharacterized protein LOC112878922 [Panicum hallii]PAN08747.1 hypothetical protein PAHAL_1G433900 [Panicum hallii]PUZ78081.1 hypothetical protein GQ55_1G424600 [Panicum hallii var. hallii]